MMCIHIGAIEVSIATMRKADRCHTDQVYVSGFVPSYLLPNKRPNSLDPFVLPLVKEIEELFIDGNIIIIYVCHTYIHTYTYLSLQRMRVT